MFSIYSGRQGSLGTNGFPEFENGILIFSFSNLNYTSRLDLTDSQNQVAQKKYANPRNLLYHIRLGVVVVARMEKYANPRNPVSEESIAIFVRGLAGFVTVRFLVLLEGKPQSER